MFAEAGIALFRKQPHPEENIFSSYYATAKRQRQVLQNRRNKNTDDTYKMENALTQAGKTGIINR